MKPHHLAIKVRWLRLQSGRTQRSMTGVSYQYVSLLEKSPPASVRKFDQYLQQNFAHRLAIEPITAPLDLRGRLRAR